MLAISDSSNASQMGNINYWLPISLVEEKCSSFSCHIGAPDSENKHVVVKTIFTKVLCLVYAPYGHTGNMHQCTHLCVATNMVWIKNPRNGFRASRMEGFALF